jgi:hypothetical protein
MPMRLFTVTGRSTASRIAADAIAHQRRLRHQAGAEAARLHAVARAADVQVDLVVTVSVARHRRLREDRRIGPAELQGHRRSPPD